MLVSALLALLASPAAAPQSTPKEFLHQIREQGAKAPLVLFDNLAKLGTEESFDALVEAIGMQKTNPRINHAVMAMKHFRGLGELEVDAVKYLQKRTESRKANDSMTATRALGKLWPSSAVGLAELAMESKSLECRTVALMGLLEHDFDVNVKLLKKMASSKDVMVRYEAALALLMLPANSLDSPESSVEKREQVSKSMRSKNVADRLAAVEYLRNESVNQKTVLLENALRDKDPRVNRKCLSVLESLATTHAVGVLVRRMETADVGERWRTAEALRRLSGMTFRPTFEPWKRWWALEKANYTPPSNREQGAGSAEAKPLGQENDAAQANAADDHTAASFYGLSIRAQHLVFAVDSSDSMKKEASGGRSREEIAKEQLHAAISALPKGSTFDIVNFGKNAQSWNGVLVDANKKSRRQALEHVGKMRLSWGTQVYEGFRDAFHDPTADAIVLLTDGDPQLSLVQDRNLIRQIIVQWNRTRHIQIDCITIGTDRAWLRRIAVATGGRYKRVE
jgi:hypothetical protein